MEDCAKGLQKKVSTPCLEMKPKLQTYFMEMLQIFPPDGMMSQPK